MNSITQAVEDAVAAIRSKHHVRIVGKRLGGRTTVLKSAVAALEAAGAEVIMVSGERVARDQPGYALEQLRRSMGYSVQSRDLISQVDALASALPAQAVLACDDIHVMDSLSLRVFAAVRQRLGIRTIVTELTGSARSDDFPAVWPEATVQLHDLDLETTAILLQEKLGVAVEPRTLAQIYGKAGGNLGLTIALAESARREKLLVLEGGAWRASGGRLWNRHLESLLDGLVAEVSQEEGKLIRWLAESGPFGVQNVLERYSEETLRGVIARGYAAPVGSEGTTLLQVWPPLFVSRYRPSLFTGLARAEEVPEDQDASIDFSSWSGSEIALLAREFVEHDEYRAQKTFRAWTVGPTVSHALSYLRVASGMANETERVRRVFDGTPVEPRLENDPMKLLFALMKVQWLLFEERQQDEAEAMLERIRAFSPTRIRELCSSYKALKILDGQGVSDPIELAPEEEPNVFLLSGVFMRAVAMGDLPLLRSSLAAARKLPEAELMVALLDPLLLLLEGDAQAAVRVALHRRESARARRDRSAYSALTYMAVLGAEYLGDQALMKSLLSEGTVVGQPRIALTPIYAAFFTFEAGLAHFNGQRALRDHLQREASLRSSVIGMLLGMGSDYLDAIIRHSEEPEAFDEAIAECISARIDAGYYVGALQTAASALTVHWGMSTASAMLEAHRLCSLPAYETVAELTEITMRADAEALRAWGQSYGEDRQDRDLISRFLGSVLRWAGKQDAPEFFAALTTVLDGITRSTGDRDEVALADLLSKREIEIGRLAGGLTNPEIADRLGLSRRTVENHISNALRKSRFPNRNGLSEALNAQYPAL